MGLCGDYGPLDFSSSCVRASWSAFLPAAFVFALCLSTIPVPQPARRILHILGAPFKTYLTLHEAEAIDITSATGDKTFDGDDTEIVLEVTKFVPLWRTVAFVFVGIVQSFCWVAHGSYLIYNDITDIWAGMFSFLVAASWLYTVVRPIIFSPATAPTDMFTLYLILLSTAVLQFGGALFDNRVLGAPLPSNVALFGLLANLLSILLLLAITVTMPLALPSNRVDPKEIVSDFYYSKDII